MLMKPIIEITLRLDTVVKFGVITLLFNRQPTKEQIVEATRHYLSDQGYAIKIGIEFMNMVKNSSAPKENDVEENDYGVIFNNTTLFFEVK